MATECVGTGDTSDISNHDFLTIEDSSEAFSNYFASLKEPQNDDETDGNSSYTLASDESQSTRSALYHSAQNCSNPPVYITDASVQRSRVPVVQRSTLATDTSMGYSSSFWYLLAMVLPVLQMNNGGIWNCTTDRMSRSIQVFLAELMTVCANVRAYIRRVAREQFSRDLFAAAMDIVLVIYALGFLFLSLYQSTVFG